MTASKVTGHSRDVRVFWRLFQGRTDIYGTYNPESGRSWIVKKPVTQEVILNHLKGTRSYGVFPLVVDRTRTIVVDFDEMDSEPPIEFIQRARHYGIRAHLEKSKSKGFHAWIFFPDKGVLASKARLVVKHILEEIEHPDTEVFPKQDKLDSPTQFGNFINAPLFGRLVPEGRTVFLDPENLKPYPDQFAFLVTVLPVSETLLNEIIELNDLLVDSPKIVTTLPSGQIQGGISHGLPACAQRILSEGVSQFQRKACFRMAVHLKRVGLPFDLAVSALKTWAKKNTPAQGKRIITGKEIYRQSQDAYDSVKDYRAYGCEDPAISPFCDPACPIRRREFAANANQKKPERRLQQ